MKNFQVIIATIGFLVSGSCEKRAPANSPKNLNGLDGLTEPQLIESKKQLENEIDSQKARIMELERDISELEMYRDDLRPRLEQVEEEKKQMISDMVKLRDRWAREIEGIAEEPSRPIHETFRLMTEQMEHLLQENQELRQKLKETEK
jgi:DNA anti-recombination protein RmuC